MKQCKKMRNLSLSEVLPIVNFGGADGIRTHYLLNANQTLSQLSYSPTEQDLLY
jgi:hypothetical protein